MSHYVKGWLIQITGSIFAGIAKYHHMEDLMIIILVVSNSLFGEELTLGKIESK